MQRMKNLRKKLGMSQGELSQKAGLSLDTISRYERGEREPRVSHLQKIAIALGCPARDLLDDENPPQPPTPDEQTQSPESGALLPEAEANSAA
jgi:transcriptional regulator with XRE-family HTH domain